jgi:hypothetical protein
MVCLALAALLVPLASMSSDQLPAPFLKAIPAGETTIFYAGQSLKFTTDVPLKISMNFEQPGKIRLKVKAYDVPVGGNSPASTSLRIMWENWNNEIYFGPPPVDETLDELLLTESGFTEK